MVTPKQRAIEDMILIGQQMSNLCYNLRQALQQDGNRKSMDVLFRQWDSAVRKYRNLTAKKQKAGELATLLEEPK